VRLTHRVAGPLFRLERHLEAVKAGQDPGELRLREEDQLQGLAELVNEALAAARQGAPQTDRDAA
jgi:hypothetical protein